MRDGGAIGERYLGGYACGGVEDGAGFRALSADFSEEGVVGDFDERVACREVAVDGHGSARAPEGYDVHAALTECACFLERFGGHTAAGGFIVKEGMFDAFSAGFKTACAAQRERSGIVREEGTVGEPELWLSPGDLTMEMHGSLSLMAPFGEGNPEPVFGLRDVAFSDVRLMGEQGKHASFVFSDRRIPRATWWSHGSEAEKLRAKSASRLDRKSVV